MLLICNECGKLSEVLGIYRYGETASKNPGKLDIHSQLSALFLNSPALFLKLASALPNLEISSGPNTNSILVYDSVVSCQ